MGHFRGPSASHPRGLFDSNLDMDVGSNADEDSTDEEEKEVEDRHQLVEHAVATVVHGGVLQKMKLTLSLGDSVLK